MAPLWIDELAQEELQASLWEAQCRCSVESIEHPNHIQALERRFADVERSFCGSEDPEGSAWLHYGYHLAATLSASKLTNLLKRNFKLRFGKPNADAAWKVSNIPTKFVNFEADKRYQTADWRARPLPPAMFDYARSDTVHSVAGPHV
jgi:hypothetical protein